MQLHPLALRGAVRLGAGAARHLRHHLCQWLPFLGRHQVQGIQELQEARGRGVSGCGCEVNGTGQSLGSVAGQPETQCT